MELNPSFPVIFPYLSRSFTENPCPKLERPSMVPLQKISTFSQPPPSNTNLYPNNSHHFQHHPFNGENYHPGFVVEVPSSINKISMIPTPHSIDSYQTALTNEPMKDFSNTCYPIAFAQNKSKIEAMHGCLNNGKGILDFPQKIPFQSGEYSQPQMGPSLSPSLLSHDSAHMKPRLQTEDLSIIGTANFQQDIGQNVVAGGRMLQKKRPKKSSEIQHKATPNIIKGQWTPKEDG